MLDDIKGRNPNIRSKQAKRRATTKRQNLPVELQFHVVLPAMSETLHDTTLTSVCEQDTLQLTRDEPQKSATRERKRNQNRVAQRTYRTNIPTLILPGWLVEWLILLPRTQSKTTIAGSGGCVRRSSDTIIPSLMADAGISGPHDPLCDDQMWTFDTVLDDVSPPGTLSNIGRTALHRAVCNGNESIARLLLKKGADIMKQDSYGKTALHLAVENGSEGLVKVILENNANLNVTDSLGRTALFQAVQNENEVVAKLLLENSIDVNWKDTLGDAALHLAVERGSESMTLLLLTHGANIDA